LIQYRYNFSMWIQHKDIIISKIKFIYYLQPKFFCTHDCETGWDMNSDIKVTWNPKLPAQSEVRSFYSTSGGNRFCKSYPDCSPCMNILQCTLHLMPYLNYYYPSANLFSCHCTHSELCCSALVSSQLTVLPVFLCTGT